MNLLNMKGYERMLVLGIDPGSSMSAAVLLDIDFDNIKINDPKYTIKRESPFPAKFKNLELYEALEVLKNQYRDMIAVIEGMQYVGGSAGMSVFQTVFWIGRFFEKLLPISLDIVSRMTIKTHFCGTPRSNDSDILKALIDRYGPKGKKANPGPTYGFSGDMWSALAVATFAADVEMHQRFSNQFKNTRIYTKFDKSNLFLTQRYLT